LRYQGSTGDVQERKKPYHPVVKFRDIKTDLQTTISKNAVGDAMNTPALDDSDVESESEFEVDDDDLYISGTATWPTRSAGPGY
jgi:hypothetical protein